MVTGQGGSRRLRSDVWKYFIILIRLKVKVSPVKSVSRNLHFMVVLQTCVTTFKGVMVPCMSQNLLVLQDKRKLNQY